MLSKCSLALAGALSAAIFLLAHSRAEAHAVCGNRIFPATLGIDDPGVGDELALPTLTYIPQIPAGRRNSTRRSATPKPSSRTSGFRLPTARPGSIPRERLGKPRY